MRLEEVRDMYARSLSGHRRRTPPPGYAGTAFGPGLSAPAASDGEPAMESRRHTPEEYRAERPLVFPPVENPVAADLRDIGGGGEQTGLERSGDGKVRLPEPLEELLSGLRGRLGAEEVILLLVMLLLSADGAGIETLLLGVVLLAGRG